jgi:queuosine precursor transporter
MTGITGLVGKVRAYKRDVFPGRIGGLNMASTERGPYRLRTASDAPYMGAYGYSRHETWLGKIGAGIAAIVRLVVCTLVLGAWLTATFLYRDTALDVFGIGTGWLNLAHVLVPVGFYCVFMTNRRYGPAYAFAEVVTAMALAAGLVLFARDALAQVIPLDSAPSLRETVAFGSAFFLASFVSIVAFDGARGPHWWTAPLIGFLAAAIIFATVFFAVLYSGTGRAWLGECMQYMGLIAGEGLLLLIPFWVMRRMVPPVAGFGGY